ncbi:MAG: ABC transporter ATP-binding protein [Bacteroidota bacterium]
MKVPFVTGYMGYFNILRRFSGRSMYVLMGLSLIVAATDGIGITMLIPLLKASEVGDSGLGKQDIFIKIFTSLGIPPTFNWVLGAIGVLFLAKGVIKYFEGYLGASIRARLFTKWRMQLLRHYSSLDYQYYVSKNTGHFTNIISTQVGSASHFVLLYSQFSSKVLTALVYLGLALFLNWQLSSMAMIAGLVIIFLLRRITSETKRISVLNAVETGVLNKFLIQLLQSFKYLQATARFSHLEESTNNSVRKLSEYRLKIGKLTAILLALQEPLGIAFMIGIMFYQVNVLGESLAPLLVVLILFYRTVNTLMLAQGQWQQIMNLAGSLDVVVDEFDEVEQHHEARGKVSLPVFEQSIEFKNVDFAFGEKKVVKDVSFSIPKNSTIALVGGSGAGKTTLTDLISLLIKPTGGQLLFDGIPANELDIQSWRNKIGFVTQDTVIFDDSIANNITLWEEEFESDENVQKEVKQAARQAYCDEFISSLPNGYYTQIGERGIKLSGGQKQRLSIARELYKQPDILILDEATSALDSKSEQFIQESIDTLKGTMTVILIAHRLSTIKNVDKIIVLDQGRVKEEGSFDELNSFDTQFRQMAEYQRL